MTSEAKTFLISFAVGFALTFAVLSLSGCGTGHGSNQLYKTVIHQEVNR